MSASAPGRWRGVQRREDRRGALRYLLARAYLLAFGWIVAANATIMVSSSEQLSFGAIVAGPVGGTVTLSPAGIRSCGAGVTCLPQSSAGAATFIVSGDAFMAYAISLPAFAVLSDGAGHTMMVDGFTDSLDGSGLLDGGGLASFSIGAILHVSPGQSMGAYNGTFDVTVEYQ